MYFLLQHNPVSWYLYVFRILCVLNLPFTPCNVFFTWILRPSLGSFTSTHFFTLPEFGGNFFMRLVQWNLNSSLKKKKKKTCSCMTPRTTVAYPTTLLRFSTWWFLQFFFCQLLWLLLTGWHNSLPLQRSRHDPPWQCQNAPSVDSVQVLMPVTGISLADWKKNRKEFSKETLWL